MNISTQDIQDMTPVTASQRDEADICVDMILVDDSAMREFRNTLHNFFVSKNFSQKVIAPLYDTYWFWYTQAMYKDYLSLSHKDFLTMFSKTLVMSHLLGLQPISSLFNYLSVRCVSQEDQQRLFLQIKKQLLLEKYPVNPSITEVPILLAMVLREVRMHRKREETVNWAKYLVRFNTELFQNLPLRYNLSQKEKEALTENLLFHLNFFQSTQDITGILMKYEQKLLPQNDNALALELIKNYIISAPRGGSLKNVPLFSPEEREKLDPEFVHQQEQVFARIIGKGNNVEPKAASNAEKPTAMSYDQIKTMIDSRFEKDASGEYTNIEGVMVMLSGFAADQNDPQIAELYYFDEQKGKFMWNNAILGT